MNDTTSKWRKVAATIMYAIAVVATGTGPGAFVLLNLPNIILVFALESFSTILLTLSVVVALPALLIAIVLDYRSKPVTIIASVWTIVIVLLLIVPVRFAA